MGKRQLQIMYILVICACCLGSADAGGNKERYRAWYQQDYKIFIYTECQSAREQKKRSKYLNTIESYITAGMAEKIRNDPKKMVIRYGKEAHIEKKHSSWTDLCEEIKALSERSYNIKAKMEYECMDDYIAYTIIQNDGSSFSNIPGLQVVYTVVYVDGDQKGDTAVLDSFYKRTKAYKQYVGK